MQQLAQDHVEGSMSTLGDASRASSSVGPTPATGASAGTRALFGEVMGLVAFTLGFTALGAYVGRDLGGGWGIAAFVVAFALLIALNFSVNRNHTVAMTMLFAIGLLLGLVLGPGLAAITAADPAAVWQAAGATALFTAALGSYGWATRRDLAPAARVAFWALIALIVFAIAAIFVTIPGANLIWAIAGLISSRRSPRTTSSGCGPPVRTRRSRWRRASSWTCSTPSSSSSCFSAGAAVAGTSERRRPHGAR